MKILGKEIEFDFFDADEMEKWDKYSTEMKNSIDKLDVKNMKQSEFIRNFCTIIEECFDSIFGKGTSEKFFEKKQNFRLCVDAYKDLVKARKEQEKCVMNEINDLQKELNEVSKEYAPNRATRRSKK